MISLVPSGQPKYVVRRMRVVDNTKMHIYLRPKHRRREFSWSSLLRAAVYDSFDEAMKDACSLATTQGWQIVPVGYAGDPYWKNPRHVRHTGSMARLHCQRVFLVDPQTGDRIEV